MTESTTPAPPPATFEQGGHTWVTVPEAARRLGVTTGRIYHLTSADRVPTRQGPGGLLYLRADAVEDYRRYRDQLTQLRATGQAV